MGGGVDGRRRVLRLALARAALVGTIATAPLALFGCLPSSGAFQCGNNAQCESLGSGARCEAAGVCSEIDSSCASQRRYAESAGELAGLCVPSPDELPDAGTNPSDGGNSVNVTNIAGGNKSLCAVTDVGNVWCWGKALHNPNEFYPSNPSPVLIRIASDAPLSGASRVAVGESHACALLSSGRVSCWGHNYHGQLGIDGESRFHAEEVPGLDMAVAVYAAGNHTCALRSDGALWCWGRNANGELGDGSLEPRSEPEPFGAELSDIAAAGLGRYHTCAIDEAAGLLCAGRNSKEQIGIGSATPDAVTTPASVIVDMQETPLADVTAVAGGVNHTCAVAAGNVLCWGEDNGGELGQESPGIVRYPAVLDHSSVPDCEPPQLQTRNEHGCTRCNSGEIACWGNGDEGRLGAGATGTSTSLIVMEGLAGAASDLAVTANTACAVVAGEVQCWGSDLFGELGDGLPYGEGESSSEPRRVDF